MDRRTLLRGGLALAGGALMPAAGYVDLDDLAARTYVLRRRYDEARPGAVEALERHAAALYGLLCWSPRTGLAAIVADACATTAIAMHFAGRTESALRWGHQGLAVAEHVGDADAHALNAVWVSDAFVAAQRPAEALAMLQRAETFLGSEPMGAHTRAAVEAHRVLASAAAGDAYGSAAAVDRADVALDEAVATPKPDWARIFGPNWLASWRAAAALRLRKPYLAEEPLQQIMARAPQRLTLARAQARVGLAEVAWARNDLDQTCALLTGAVPVLKRGGTNRELRRVHTLRRSFTRHADSRHVRELDEVLNA